MTEEVYKPFVPEEAYKVILSKDEVLLIQKLREMSYGSLTVHLVNRKVVRTETVNSELAKDRKKDTVTIALEVIGN